MENFKTETGISFSIEKADLDRLRVPFRSSELKSTGEARERAENARNFGKDNKDFEAGSSQDESKKSDKRNSDASENISDSGNAVVEKALVGSLEMLNTKAWLLINPKFTKKQLAFDEDERKMAVEAINCIMPILYSKIQNSPFAPAWGFVLATVVKRGLMMDDLKPDNEKENI